MPRMTSEEYAAFEARSQRSAPATADAVEIESQLHQEILDECRRRGWRAYHGSMAHRTRRTVGEPDFIIAADGGRTFYVECKRRDGKLTPAQMGDAAWLKRLGHKHAVVRSLKEFSDAINGDRD